MAASTETPRRLESYVCGEWTRGTGSGEPLLDASTGETVAIVDSTGLDYAAALDWGRERGGRALRAMTFHERALALRALGHALSDSKEYLHAESLATGATRADAQLDIEGGIGTLLSFASKARRELPNARILPEGEVEPLSRDGSFAAQHVLSPLRGIAIHINAFNFPCWGLLEKIAPNLLAGVPCIVKPASNTAYLAESLARRILDTGLLPEGAFQLVCGSAGDMLDHVTGQDAVTFTGSATTGRALRATPAIVENSTRFTMEADSLNASILGPDAVAGSPEFGLFVDEVVREMTSKAGQKCTAIRRAIAPREQVDALVDALSVRLGEIAVGNPADERTRMGPLASLAQREEVRSRIRDLKAETEIVAGNPETPEVAFGDVEKGAFLNPVLLHCERPLAAEAVHEVEAFGPVSTVLPYDTLDEAAELARRGKGSLVASVFTDDKAVALELATGIAPLHGRVLIGNRASAKSSTGHGSPLAPLVHGGPGRAGGGEEMGGMRGVRHYMQRTAIQAPPRLLSAAVGRWIDGADTDRGMHPFRKSLAELKIGDQVVTESRQITQQDVERFAHFTGDTFYAHMDSEAAKANPFFDDRVAHGYLVVSFAAGLFVDPAPGPVLANYGVDNLRFMAPVYFGDSLRVRLTCKEVNPRATADHGEVRWDCLVTNQEGATVARYDVLTMVAKEWVVD